MNNSEPTTDLSVSKGDNEKVSGFAIQFESPTRLRIQHNPNNALFITAFLLMLGFVAFLAYTEKIFYSVSVAVFVLFIFVQDLKTLRRIRCVLDKQTGQFHYTRGSVLGINYNNQDISGNIVDISQVEMKRYGDNGEDNFQIVFLLKNHERLFLSDQTLDFEDCHKFAEKIRNFIGSEVPLKAIN